MYRPRTFLEPIGCYQAFSAGELVEKVVFETEKGGGADDGCFGEDATDNFFASGLVKVIVSLEPRENRIETGGWYLGAEELGSRVSGSVIRRDMHKAVDIIFGHGFGYALCAFDVHIIESKVSESRLATYAAYRTHCVLGRIVPSDEVVNNI